MQVDNAECGLRQVRYPLALRALKYSNYVKYFKTNLRNFGFCEERRRKIACILDQRGESVDT
jgi:hypothetical protein